MWTLGIGESEYLDFLSVLLEHILTGSGNVSALYKPVETVGRLEDANVSKDDHGEKTARQKRVKRMKKRRVGAMKIQAGARGSHDRKQVKKRRHAVVKIQANARGKLARKEARDRREAIPVIQAAGRGKAGRSKAEARRASVVLVQAGGRGMIVRKQTRRQRGRKALKATFKVTAAFAKDDYDEEDVARRLNEYVEAEIAKIDSTLKQALSSQGDTLLAPLPTQEFEMGSIRPIALPSRLTVGERKHASETYLSRHKGPNLNQKSRVFDFMNKPSRRELAKAEEAKQHTNQRHIPPHAGHARRVLPDIPRTMPIQPQSGRTELSVPSPYARAPRLLPGERQRVQFAPPVEPAAYARPPPPEVRQMIMRSEMNAATEMLKEMEDLLRPGRIEKMRRGVTQGKSTPNLHTGGAASKQVAATNVNGGRHGSRTRMTQGVSAPVLPHRQVAARVAPRASRMSFAEGGTSPPLGNGSSVPDAAPDGISPWAMAATDADKPESPLKPRLAMPPAPAPLVSDDGNYPPAGVHRRISDPVAGLSLPSIT